MFSSLITHTGRGILDTLSMNILTLLYVQCEGMLTLHSLFFTISKNERLSEKKSVCIKVL